MRNISLDNHNLDVNQKNDKGLTASRTGLSKDPVNHSMTDMLLSHYQINLSKTICGMPLLCYAFAGNNESLFKLLLNTKIDGMPLLHHAVMKDDKQFVELLLNKPNLNVNQKDNKERTALEVALFKDPVNYSIVEMLLSHHEIDLSIEIDGRPLLHHAVMKDSGLLLKLLLDHTDLNVNQKDNKGRTVLEVALSKDLVDYSIVDMLLYHPKIDLNVEIEDKPVLNYAILNLKANQKAKVTLNMFEQLAVFTKTDSGPLLKIDDGPLLHHAVMKDNEQSVKLLLYEPNLNVNQKNKGRTALEVALFKDLVNYSIVEMLLSHHEIDLSMEIDGRPLLHYAMLKNDKQFVELLLNKPNLNVNQKAKVTLNMFEQLAVFGQCLVPPPPRKIEPRELTPLEIALFPEHIDCGLVKMLLSHPKIDLNIKIGDMSLLHYAVMKDDELLLRLLLDNTNLSALKVLTRAISKYNVCSLNCSMFKMLLSHPKIDLSEIEGRPLLNYAIGRDNEWLVQFLLNNDNPNINIDVNLQDDDGNTPLHLAVTKGDEGIVRKILNFDNVRTDIKNFYNKTPIDMTSNKDIIDMLSQHMKEHNSDFNTQKISNKSRIIKKQHANSSQKKSFVENLNKENNDCSKGI